MFRRLSSAALAVAMSVFLVACGSQDKADSDTAQPLRVGMSGSYFPFGYTENGELQGFEVDVTTEIAKRMNRPVEYVTGPFSSLFGMLESNRVDTIANQITVTDARREKYNFADSYVFDGAQITVRDDNDDIHGVGDLHGKTVAVNLGSNFEELIKAHDTNGDIDVRTYNTGIEQEVVLGRADAFIMDRLSAAELMKKSGLPLKPAGEPIEIIENSLPFLKNEQSEALRLKVNKALKGMRADGTLKAISEKWFKTDITKKS
ncbi:amino acid ABC transporter substrate-binding protein [Sansalvadorimonas verongulae]|uniref:amino acid ABC transporter substrate-binding protein n=1 Tax=Sansalvadorimonas verongulae TaxID=2172824 RepID=UPI0012BBBBC9|nr:amino acid ABC transporter substrate-binding protein [Sansalvadorimonas verongulae]MTI14574.1 amino acid ABC transporter substrate-binding protein [Sansalvadorimonas verongulae]